MYIFNLFQIFLLSSTHFSLFYATSVTRTPGYACEGEDVRVSCVLTISNDGDIFTSRETSFIIGDIDDYIDKYIIDRKGIHYGFDLSRFRADTPLGNSTFVTGSITLLSYNSSTDEGLRMGCHIKIRHKGASISDSFIKTLILVSAAPPSAPSLQNSMSNFNTATCSADISLSWNTPPSNRTVDRYFLYLDRSPLATTNSNSYIHSTILNINTDYQYSVSAMSCAGNSTNSSTNINSFGYSLTNNSLNLTYENVTATFTINWGLNTTTKPRRVLKITYSLQLLYSHSRQGVTYTYTDSTNFTLPSSQLSYNTVLTAHNFTQLDGVETNITANLTIVEQCGQSFNRGAMEYSFKIDNSAAPSTTTLVPKSIVTSSNTPTLTNVPTVTSIHDTTTAPKVTSMHGTIVFVHTSHLNKVNIIIGCTVAAGFIIVTIILLVVIGLIGLTIHRSRKRCREEKLLRGNENEVKKGGVMYAELKFLKTNTGIKRSPIPRTKYSEILDFKEIQTLSSDISP